MDFQELKIKIGILIDKYEESQPDSFHIGCLLWEDCHHTDNDPEAPAKLTNISEWDGEKMADRDNMPHLNHPPWTPVTQPPLYSMGVYDGSTGEPPEKGTSEYLQGYMEGLKKRK